MKQSTHTVGKEVPHVWGLIIIYNYIYDVLRISVTRWSNEPSCPSHGKSPPTAHQDFFGPRLYAHALAPLVVVYAPQGRETCQQSLRP